MRKEKMTKEKVVEMEKEETERGEMGAWREEQHSELFGLKLKYSCKQCYLRTNHSTTNKHTQIAP